MKCKRVTWCAKPVGHNGDCTGDGGIELPSTGSVGMDTAAQQPSSVAARAALVDEYARQQGAAGDAFRLEAAKLVLESLDRMAAAGVRVFEVGDGPTRVRAELEVTTRASHSLIRRIARDTLRETAADRPAGQPAQDDPETAESDDQQRDEPDEGDDAEQAGDELDIAHTR